MKFKLIIDKTKDEEIVATVHESSFLTEQIEALVTQYTGSERIVAYIDDDMKILSISQIECITVIDGKTYAICEQGVHYRLKQRLYELEKLLPATFIKINKSCIANEKRIERFSATISGAVDVIFMCGYRDCVSRRCFAEIKRRYNI
jgi:DNA-binding LytR/AlgR family response regulator